MWQLENSAVASEVFRLLASEEAEDFRKNLLKSVEVELGRMADAVFRIVGQVVSTQIYGLALMAIV